MVEAGGAKYKPKTKALAVAVSQKIHTVFAQK
jgi:hypothetical protein